jgi:hypothetical protein
MLSSVTLSRARIHGDTNEMTLERRGVRAVLQLVLPRARCQVFSNACLVEA